MTRDREERRFSIMILLYLVGGGSWVVGCLALVRVKGISGWATVEHRAVGSGAAVL